MPFSEPPIYRKPTTIVRQRHVKLKTNGKMRKIYLAVLLLVTTSMVFAQAPEKMSYQAIIRDASNGLVTSEVGMKISIRKTTSTGTVVYSETHTPTPNANGLVSLEIGTGAVGTGVFSAIDWADGPYFIQTETDPTGGVNYTIDGTTQLLTVPYALYAKKAGSAPGVLPAGGTADQVLSKINSTDYNAQWITPSATGGLSEYAHFYNLEAQVVALEADVIFSDNGLMAGEITHNPGTAMITLGTAGNYEVTFNVSGIEPNQFAIFQNGAPVAGGIFGSGGGTQQNTGSVILAAEADDTLTLRNHTSAAAVTLQTLAGGTQTNSNASIKIMLLGN
jgi:hypothetical protein